MSSVKIRLALPSSVILGHPLIYCLNLELGAAGLVRLWEQGIPTSLHPHVSVSPVTA